VRVAVAGLLEPGESLADCSTWADVVDLMGLEMFARSARMDKKHVFRPDAGEGLELRLTPSGVAAGAAAEVARVDAHAHHGGGEAHGGHKDQGQDHGKK
jgi:hypothetical protein